LPSIKRAALASIDARQSHVVELRFFAGLNIDEAAEALGMSPATVERECALAKAWLFRRAVAATVTPVGALGT
jgi:RNA polymerase sigma factor (sigma-70 family)